MRQQALQVALFRQKVQSPFIDEAQRKELLKCGR